MGYVIIVSFILHLISFYFLVIFYQRQRSQKPFDREKTLKEMEELLVAYTTEMKDNNERLAKRISNERKAQPSMSFNSSSDNIKYNQDNTKNTTQASMDLSRSNPAPQYNVKPKESEEPVVEEKEVEEFPSYLPPIPEDENPPLNTSSTSKILSLHSRGYSTKEIAKQLNMGAGEVELLLKINK